MDNQEEPAQQPRDTAQYRVVKASLKSLALTQETLTRFRTLVTKMDKIMRFSYAFARFIFVHELAYNPHNFAPLYGSLWATEAFFREVIKKVGGVNLQQPGLPALRPNEQETAQQRHARERFRHINMLNAYWNMFQEFSGYQLDGADRIEGFSSSISAYAAKQMEATYLNLIKNEFGNRLRQLINFVLNVTALEDEIKRQMQGNTDDEVEAMIREAVRGPARNFKVALAIALGTGNRDLPANIEGSIFEEHWHTFGFLFNCYPTGRVFVNNSVYYDCKANEKAHMYAFYRIARFAEATQLTPGSRKMKTFQCMPLRNSFIPHYMQLDTLTLKRNILGMGSQQASANLNTQEDKMDAWRQALYLGNEPGGQVYPFRGTDNFLFRGTLFTDGVGVSILLTNEETRAGHRRGHYFRPSEQEAYITDYDFHQENTTINNDIVVYFDPGHRDIYHGAHEVEEHYIRFTLMQRSFKCRVKKYRQILNDRKTPEIRALENLLARAPKKTTLNPTLFDVYLTFHRDVYPGLTAFYATEMAEDGVTPLHRKLKLSAILNSNRYYQEMAIAIREFAARFAPQVPGDQAPGDQAPGDQAPGDQAPGDQAPGDQAPDDQAPDDQAPEEVMIDRPRRRQPGFGRGKSRNSARNHRDYLWRQQGRNMANRRPPRPDRLAGDSFLLVIGNYGAGNTRYQAPVPGKGIRMKLKALGIPNIYLINEYRTSKTCPTCLQVSMKNFRLCRNPRPQREGQQNYLPLIMRWGLVRCTNLQCAGRRQIAAGDQQIDVPAILNRDTVACVNFRAIVRALRAGQPYPPAFVRPDQE
ncbi:hypothetical protein MBANPS3_000416 [Mucor bainieri]